MLYNFSSARKRKSPIHSGNICRQTARTDKQEAWKRQKISDHSKNLSYFAREKRSPTRSLKQKSTKLFTNETS